MLTGDYGPFTAGVEIQVPVWMAIELRKGMRCRIVPPEWMCEEFLQSVVEYER